MKLFFNQSALVILISVIEQSGKNRIKNLKPTILEQINKLLKGNMIPLKALEKYFELKFEPKPKTLNAQVLLSAKVTSRSW